LSKEGKEIVRAGAHSKTPTGVKNLLCKLIFAPYRGSEAAAQSAGQFTDQVHKCIELALSVA
jgi:hypothetical protein